MVSPMLARATEGAAPKSPAKPLGFKTSPIKANAETIVPPMRNLTTHSIRALLEKGSRRRFTHRKCHGWPIAPFGPATNSSQMPKRSKRSPGLADPTRLPPFESKHADLTVIIETPKGSRNKYAYDPEERIFALRKVLPAGMAFPYDFGFVPSTL